MPSALPSTSRATRRARQLVLLPVVAVALLSACDESIPPPDSINETYTLWGAFDPRSDVQAVRVVPITDTIGLGTRDALDVTVLSTNVETGAETVWRDSVVQYANGSIGHVYLGDLNPDFESRHVFRVVRPEGAEVSALVPVPPLVEPLLQTVALTAREATYPIFWPGAPQVNAPTLTYFLESGTCQRDSVQIAFPGASDPAEFGWQMAFRLSEDSAPVAARFQEPMALLRLTVRGEVASEGWRLPLAAARDRELLLQPTVLTNVENGFGFIGSAYRTSLTWSPTPAELQRSPFEFRNFGQDCSRG